MESAICSLWKLYKCLLRQIAREFMLFLVNNLMKNNLRKSRPTKFLKRARTLCTLHSCYIRMYSFSANQRREIFPYVTYIKNENLLSLFLTKTFIDKYIT